MTNKQTRNLAASVRARLLALAQGRGDSTVRICHRALRPFQPIFVRLQRAPCHQEFPRDSSDNRSPTAALSAYPPN